MISAAVGRAWEVGMKAYTLSLPSWGKGLSPEELEYEKPQPLYLLFLSYTISVIHDLPKIATSLFLKYKMKERSHKDLCFCTLPTPEGDRIGDMC